jgi:hypothetical protein
MKDQKTEKVKKMQITAPWCEGQTVEVGSYLEMIRVCASQLRWMLCTGASIDVDRTQSDLEGYEEITAKGNNAIARRFFEIKDADRRNHDSKDNKGVIQQIKDEGLWNEYVL